VLRCPPESVVIGVSGLIDNPHLTMSSEHLHERLWPVIDRGPAPLLCGTPDRTFAAGAKSSLQRTGSVREIAAA